jgi:hypothetical protein
VGFLIFLVIFIILFMSTKPKFIMFSYMIEGDYCYDFKGISYFLS